MTPVPRWRVAAGIAVLLGMGGLLAAIAPVYLHNLELQNFVAALTQDADQRTKTDGELRDAVLQRAHSLRLPVTEGDVHILRSQAALRIEVRYVVPVEFPGYAVNLHFYPGAGSRP